MRECNITYNITTYSLTNNNNLIYLLLISLLLLAHFAHVPVKVFLQAGNALECVNIDANTTTEREKVTISSFKVLVYQKMYILYLYVNLYFLYFYKCMLCTCNDVIQIMLLSFQWNTKEEYLHSFSYKDSSLWSLKLNKHTGQPFRVNKTLFIEKNKFLLIKN